MINTTYITIDQSVQDVKKEGSISTRLVTKHRDYKRYANWGVRLSLSAILATSSLTYFSCNPINFYKTIEIRHKESDMYKEYKQINMNNLTATEKKYLKEMHQKYGEGPVNATELTDGMPEKWVKNFTYLTGHKKFTDKDLIFIHRTSDSLAATILINIDGQR